MAYHRLADAGRRDAGRRCGRACSPSRTTGRSGSSSARCRRRSRQILSCAAHRATAELDELSAGCGIGLFALVWGGKGSLIARNLLGGTGRLPAALGRELGARARTGCRVTALHPDGDELILDYLAGGTPRQRARASRHRRRAGAVRRAARHAGGAARPQPRSSR